MEAVKVVKLDGEINYGDTRRRMTSLATSFPTLRNADGVYPFDARRLSRWCRTSPATTSASRHAARFVLAVWNATTKWSCGRFDAVDALATWDGEHRAAFLEWAKRPWWA